jgi:NADH:ubiquinone oxidoreductase subunit F (NADH-binding)/(2Fe-2S) ferredoxin
MNMKNTSDLMHAKKQGQALLFPGTIRINVGTSTCCTAKGAELTLNALGYGLKSRGIDANVVAVGCTGLCSMEPTVEVQIPGKPSIMYGNVTEKEVPELLDAIAGKAVAKNLAILRIDTDEHVLEGTIQYGSASAGEDFSSVPARSDIDFLARQHRVILRNAGTIDPESIFEYIARGGYAALAKALSLKPDAIVSEIIKSGLRGRGGGGFPAGQKWKMCHDAADDTKYLICNVSEGEPGIGMHRSFLESDPHSVLEGLIIGAHAIGAQKAYVYIRDNYRIALKRFRKAVEDARELGLLGDTIMGSSLNFSVSIKEGGGRFVCGEETALIACIEGSVGEPRQRPPFPTNCGLFGKPTCINNVETWANIPLIIAKGSSWFNAIGSKGSKGTKVLSLSGNIARAGMIEVDMGTSLRDIIDVIGGGVANGKSLKGIQTGGPSGGVLPASKTSLHIDYDELKQEGSMLGSGGMVIMDDATDMVKIARYFTDFFVQESCGKCVPCREGVCRMRDILDEVLAGRATPEDISVLAGIAEPITRASACALGKTAPVPVQLTLRHFPDDYAGYVKS